MKPNSKTIAQNIQKYLQNKQPFVFYRKGKATKVKALIQSNRKLYTTIDFNDSGFVMAPFDLKKQVILFPRSESEEKTFELPVKNEKRIYSSFIKDEDAKSIYIKLLKKTIDFIISERADKVVVSHMIKKDYDKKKIGLLYESLLNEYENAFVYVWFHPEIGLWMGATPENMLFVNEGSFSTMALAGTQLKSDKISWGAKEQKEQQLVTDFITDQLIPIVDNFEISNPYTDYAGHLVHIRTDIKGQLSSKSSLKDLINRMHPTPAVCGTPRNIAKEFIIKNEAYERSFYTGFLGELNLNKKSDLYVNLRCMQLHDSHATLYVGGGITKDSIPEKEWEETLQKSFILAKFLS